MKFWVTLYFDMGTAMPRLQGLRPMGNGQRVCPHGSGSRETLQLSNESRNSHIYEELITVCSFLLRTVYSLKLLTYRNLLQNLANHLPSAGLDKNAEVLGCKDSWYCLAPDWWVSVSVFQEPRCEGCISVCGIFLLRYWFLWDWPSAGNTCAPSYYYCVNTWVRTKSHL